MRSVHHKTDLDIIDLLTGLITQMQKDQANGLRTDIEPVMNYVRSYTGEVRSAGNQPVRCDGLADLPFPVVMQAIILESEGIHVTVGSAELSFCSLWCMIGHFVREHRMMLLPEQDRICRN